ncbi:alpha/beta hydrolase [Saccharopolyspora cebuensis]|uniref:Alpha/beta fold hydrolase n=1 Tax=Saccharopolyspora cebuensis TaxID=418759 RepID=A0ABV4CUD0_9PSEU
MTATTELGDPEVFTTADGTRLRLEFGGSPDAPVTAVFVHGWTLARQTWDRVAAGLPRAAGGPVRTLRYDLRGHGGSEAAATGGATIRQCADDLAELLDRRITGPVVLAGHSMGGMTIMALAEQRPDLFEERIAGVALVATSCGDLRAPDLGLPGPVAALANRGERWVRARLARAGGHRLSPRAAPLRPGLRWLLFGKRPRTEDVVAAAEWVAGCHPANMAGYRDSLAEHDRIAALAVLRRVPTVVLAGLADRLTPYRHARRIAEALPEARLLVYAGAGHMVPLERSDEVTDRIAELVTAHRRS